MKHNYALTQINFRALLLSLALLFGVVDLKAQTVTALATNGTCIANGKITATAAGTTGNVAYLLLAADNSILRAAQASNIFDNLPAGSYKVQIQDDANSMATTAVIVISTSYVEMQATVNPVTVTCNDDLGTLTVNLQGGSRPYTYAITAGPETRIAQNSPTFLNLPVGNYTIAITDACGVTIVVAGSISSQNTSSNQVIPFAGTTFVVYYNKASNQLNDCSGGAFAHAENWVYTSGAQIDAKDRADLKWRYEYPSGSGKIYGKDGVLNGAPVPLAELNIPMPTDAVYPYGTGDIIIYDVCGNATRLTGKLSALTAADGREPVTGSYNCLDNGVITVNVDHVSLTCLPVTYKFTNQATGVVFERIVTTSYSTSFPGFAPGTYTVNSSDANGNSAASNATVVVPLTAAKVSVFSIDSWPNTLNSSNISIRFPQSLPPGTIMTEEVISTSNPAVAVGFSKTYAVGGTIAGLFGPNADHSWPEGNYTLKITLAYTDGSTNCSTVEDLILNVPAGFKGNLKEPTIVVACGGITLSAVATLDDPTKYYAIIQAGSTSAVGQIAHFSTTANPSGDYTAIFGNLPFGTYNLALFVNGGSVPIGFKTITYNALDALSIDPFGTGGFICLGNTVGDLVVSAISASGSALSYSIDNGHSYQTSNLFPNLAEGNYPIMVKDACGNIQRYEASMVDGTKIKASASSGTALCVGQQLKLEVNAAGATSYSWTGPNGFTSSVRNPVISNVTMGDAGAYTVVVTGSCTLASSVMITVTPVPAKPTITAGGSLVLCPSGSVALSSSAATGNQWYLNGVSIAGATAQTYLAQTAGDYTLIVSTASCSSIAAEKVTVADDLERPVKPVLTDVIAECSVTLTAPTTTDNCKGTVTGTTTDPLTYNAQGDYTVTWTFDDGNGNKETAIQKVIIKDMTKPVKPVLADVIGECSVTLTAPTTIDNCKGTVTGTTADPLTYNAQGNYTVTWTFDDGNGNTETATQNVIIKDSTKPVKPVLADVIAECSVTLIAPTTTDNCKGTVTGTTTDPLTYNAQGTYAVTWTFDDGNGNKETAIQKVIIKDITKPVKPVLADVVGECSVILSAPTTTDNCRGTVTGTTTDPLTYNAQGNYTVTWTFDDGNGNKETAIQKVIVKDITKPVKPVLADVIGECSVTVAAPTTTDNCAGFLIASRPNQLGTTTNPITYSTQGTYIITWTFDDGNGNKETAIQKVIVKDTTKPVKPVLADVIGECSVTVIAPSTTDNCRGVIQGTTTDPLTYNIQGTYTITWIFDDGSGNTETATQNVIVKDITRPVKPILADVIAECSVTLIAPTTPDNCKGTVTGTTTAPLTYNTPGNFTVTWVFDDGNGNRETAMQKVTIKPYPTPLITALGSTDFCEGASVVLSGSVANTYQWYKNGVLINGATDQNYTAIQEGSYTLITSKGNCISAISNAINVNVKPNVMITLASGNANDTKCIYTPINNIVYTITNGTGATVTGLPAGITGVYRGGVFTISGTSTVSGIFNYTVTANGNCKAAIANGTITINALPSLELTADIGPTVSKGDVVTLTAIGKGSYGWIGADIQSGQGTAVIKVRPKQTATYIVTLINENGCSISAQITIFVKEDYQLLPNNVITPNGDGKNDTWIVKNIDYYPNNRTTIYDRAGRKLFEAKGYQNNWDGTYNGMPLAEAAYIYVIDLGDGHGTIKGTLNIIRDNK